MGRKRVYEGETEAERSRLRKAAHRARVREAQGLPPVLSLDEQREQDRREDAGGVSSIRAMLVKRGRADLAEKMYPQGHRQRERV